MIIETIEQYRERMIEAFHNADCDSLISVVALPTEKEFQHLEWLLKKEYVPFLERANKALKAQKHGKWKCTYSPNGFLLEQTCSECGLTFEEPSGVDYNYCPNCGCRMDGNDYE